MTKTILLRGPAGVGKSTIGKQLQEQLSGNWANLDIDLFKHMISKDSSAFRSDTAHDVALYFIEKLLQSSVNIIAEEIFKEPFYKQTLELFEKYDYQILTVFLTAPVDTVVQRDAGRAKNKGEDIIKGLHSEIVSLNEKLVIDTSQNTIQEIADQIKAELV